MIPPFLSDQISIEELDIIYRIPHCVPISAHHKWNFDDLLEKMWQYLNLTRMWVVFWFVWIILSFKTFGILYYSLFSSLPLPPSLISLFIIVLLFKRKLWVYTLPWIFESEHFLYILSRSLFVSKKTWKWKSLNKYIYFFIIHLHNVTSHSSYTKPKGQLPDYNSPVVLRSDRKTVEDFCNKIHRTIIREFK